MEAKPSSSRLVIPESRPSLTAAAPRTGLRGLVDRAGLAVRLRKLYFLRAEVRFAPTEAQRLFVLTILIGVACGLAAVAFHLSIKAVEKLVERDASGAFSSWALWTIAIPTVGAMVCGVALQFVVPNARGSGIPQVKVAFATQSRVRMRDAIGKFFIGVLQIGSGSSLGREGPTVQICAGIASSIGRVAKVSPKSMRRLIPVGAAAGIAAAFNAPIAAVTFTIEEIVGKLDQAVLSGVIIAAALAAVIERSVIGEHPVFELPVTYGLHHVSSLVIYAILGVFAGFVSVAFTDLLLGLRVGFKRSTLPPWARPGIGGMMTGILAVIAWRFLGATGMTGGGYGMLADVLKGNIAYQVMLALCVMKVIATATSYASGGAGGIFAPTLFIGATLGGAVGELDHVVLHHFGEAIGPFALVGMGAVFSGTIRAPMTSVLIIVEMTGGYSLILPLMISNMTAYILARRLRPSPIYEALLDQDGIHLAEAAPPTLDEYPLRQASRTERLHTFRLGSRAAEVTLARADHPQQKIYPVLDDDGRLIGIITAEEMDILQSEPELFLLVNAADLMRPAVSVDLNTDLSVALETMINSGLTEVAVTDRGLFVGLIGEADIARIYLKGHRKSAHSLHD